MGGVEDTTENLAYLKERVCKARYLFILATIKPNEAKKMMELKEEE
jgi:hypothetical protein